MKNLFKAVNDLDFVVKNYDPYLDKDIQENPVYPTESLQTSSWDYESEEEEEMPTKKLLELQLYNTNKSLDENFEDDFVDDFEVKYLLVSVTKKGYLAVEHRIPDKYSKVVVDIRDIEEYGLPEFGVVDYDTIFGTRLTSFIKYDSNFFSCDERVFFEALMIKYKRFGFKPFYWSKEVIWQELGIKKDRASRIIRKFKELEIISTEVKKSVLDGRPQQITYFDLNSEAVIELLPKIFLEREFSILPEIEKYLNIKKK